MARRRRAVKRKHIPDPRYNSTFVSHLINMIMLAGKKTTAQSIVYQAFERASEKLGKGDPVDLLLGALENVRPKLEVKSRRVGGATYQVPVEISYERQQSLAYRWMISAARSVKGVPMGIALGDILADANNNQGAAVKKKEEMHKNAQANRAFAHLRW